MVFCGHDRADHRTAAAGQGVWPGARRFGALLWQYAQASVPAGAGHAGHAGGASSRSGHSERQRVREAAAAPLLVTVSLSAALLSELREVQALVRSPHSSEVLPGTYPAPAQRTVRTLAVRLSCKMHLDRARSDFRRDL